jgi:carbamate kinase
MYLPDGERTLAGVEAVIDKDLASELLAREVGAELLAREVGAELFVMATDVDGVYTGWGTPEQHKLGKVTLRELLRREHRASTPQLRPLAVRVGILREDAS